VAADSSNSPLEVVRIYLETNAISTPMAGRRIRGTGTHEWIENRVTNKGKHPY
jgi:hypothetical protein